MPQLGEAEFGAAGAEAGVLASMNAALQIDGGVASAVRGISEQFDLFVGVPDSELQALIDGLLYAHRHTAAHCLPREDVAVAAAVGHYLAGGRPLVFAGMQGLSTCVDALTSLCVAAGIPIVVLSAWSATADAGPHHKRPIGTALPDVLRAAQLEVLVADDVAGLPDVLRAASEAAAAGQRPAVVLFRPAREEGSSGA